MRKGPRSLVGGRAVEEGESESAFQAQLLKDVVQVALDGLLADVQLPGNFLVPQAARDSVRDLLLPLRELPLGLGSSAREIRQMLERQRLGTAVGPDLAGGDGAQRPEQGLEIELFSDQSARSGPQSPLDVFIRRPGCHDQDSEARSHPTEAADDALGVRTERLIVKKEKRRGLLLKQLDDAVLVVG